MARRKKQKPPTVTFEIDGPDGPSYEELTFAEMPRTLVTILAANGNADAAAWLATRLDAQDA
jgi:hypothetical protein